jgi:demethylmenaquinone methyltransferase/2-methoxy-6-polyprenyl-1,4-benzoquinol methylase
MFSGIAGKYDYLNHVLSLGTDFYWWRRMARRSGAGPGRRFLDVAAGTGDSSLALARRGAEVVSSDFTLEMLKLGPGKFQRRGRGRLIWASVGADAQRLPFRGASFDGITICYGIRNVEDRPRAYREFLRVLKPGGRLTILEFSRPRFAWLRFLYDTYSRHILPRIGGWISGSPDAYSYLPASIRAFPDQPALAAELAAAGFEAIRWSNLTGGIVALHSAEKPGVAGGMMEP